MKSKKIYSHDLLLSKKKYYYPLLGNALSKNDLNQGIKVLKSGNITMNKHTYLSLFFLIIFSVSISSQDNAIEEVIVTATKTEKTLQEVPVAVSVVTSDVIEKATILDTFDLKSVIPSLDSRQYQSSTNATFFIRGFGNGSNNPGVEPSVALFVDGVYRSKTQSQISDLPMLERIEVLRGPQSILFGKNAIGGALNFTTAQVQEEATGKFFAQLGEFGIREYQGVVNGALYEDKLFGRLSIRHYEEEGYVRNTTLNRDEPNRRDQTVRAKLMYVINDDWKIITKNSKKNFVTY